MLFPQQELISCAQIQISWRGQVRGCKSRRCWQLSAGA